MLDFLPKKTSLHRSTPLYHIDTLTEKYPAQSSRFNLPGWEPTLNPAVLEALRLLPSIYDAPGLLISLSTVAPARAEKFFDELIEIKETLYRAGNFSYNSPYILPIWRKDERSSQQRHGHSIRWQPSESASAAPPKGDRKVTSELRPDVRMSNRSLSYSREFRSRPIPDQANSTESYATLFRGWMEIDHESQFASERADID